MTNLINPAPRALSETLTVGPLGLGCWRLVNMPADDAQQRIECALEANMNLIDTADVYGLDWGGQAFGEAEALLGQVLQQAPHLREKMVLASKGGIMPGIPYDSSSAYLEKACEASLKRLHVDCIDLYQIHRPDMLTHPQELARTLENLRQAGKIREVGVSNYLPSQTEALMRHLPFKLASQQPEYSALRLDPAFDGTFDQCMANNTAVLAWSPLAGGRLASGEGLPPALAEVMQNLAERESVDFATIALAFAVAHPTNPVVLVGSTSLARIKASSRALEVSLDRTDIYSIYQASMGEALP